MRDWRNDVAHELRRLDLPADRAEEVRRELATHLEDEYERSCLRMPPEHAERRVLSVLANAKRLRCRIESAEREGQMNQRTRALWIPGVTSLLISGLLLTAIGARQRAQLVFVGSGLSPMVFYPLWLLLLPLVGALGAWLAKRKGATPFQRASVAVFFPLSIMAAAFFVILPIAMIVDGVRIGPIWILKGLGLAAINWILIPAVPLFVGSLPFLRNSASPNVN